MSSVDISRKLFQPAKHYAGAVYQQGRVTLDSDQNENAMLAGEELRRLIFEAICGGGSPNGGFTVGSVTTAPRPDDPQVLTYDFPLGAGSFYLGGLRFEAGAAETFLGQSDWLQIAPDGGLPAPPTAADLAGGHRNDLVWLEAWEQCVTATEDSEILERALGGPDTTARLRRMRRVHVTTGTAGDCAAAFAALEAGLALGATVDADTGEVVSATTLTIGFDPAGITEDPCKPATHAGFLGADNQAFRVQITAPGRFIWGADNASPLYRVQAQPFQEPGGGTTLRRIHFLTPPRDQAHFPLAGQAIEVLRWGALLPNGEKVAEPTGMLATVERSYDPDDQSIVIATAVPQAWLDWFTGPGAHALSNRDPVEDRQYFFLRLWTGGSGQAATPDLGFTVNTAQTLGGTGLTVTFSDTGRPSDYWVVAARPNTPDIVVPWALQQGLSPMGPRVFLTPLAIITWSLDANGNPAPTPHDCRHRFRPLCEMGGCCTVTVGDGQASFGDVGSIQQAIDLLPAGGGEICMLRGTYAGNVLIDGRSNITITGCGPDSLLTGTGSALITVSNSSDIRIRALGFAAPTVPAIHLDGNDTAPVIRTMLEALAISARDTVAVIGTGLRGAEVLGCGIDLQPLAAPLGGNTQTDLQPAVYLAGDDLRVERCRIEVDAAAQRQSQPLGGLQIGGGSRRVRIRDNLIRRGNGHGIILGSVRFVHADPAGIGGAARGDLIADLPVGVRGQGAFTSIGLTVSVDDNGCITIDPDPGGGTDDGTPLVPVSEGALVDVAILDNSIAQMGACGISVVRFFDLSRAADYISVEGLEITHNRITACMALDVPTLTDDQRVHAAFGGITLAFCERLVVRDNVVADCGNTAGDPICGLFVLLAEGAVVERNRIKDNGVRSTETMRPGRRGGVVFGLVLPGSVPFTLPFLNRAGLRQDGAPALRVHDNVVVTPEGRALEVIAVGPISVCDNQFTSRGGARLFRVPVVPSAGAAGYGLSTSAQTTYGAVAQKNGDPLLAFIDLLGGLVVAILDLGFSTELYLQFLGFSGLTLVDAGPADRTTFNSDDDDLFFGGEVLFNANQVSLDALAADVQVAASAVLLISTDDVVMTSNQCTCDLLLDFILTNALVFGFSVHVADNRFKEPLGLGAFRPVFLSAATLALMNETADNQGTHCFYALGAASVSVLTPNRSMIELFQANACNAFNRQNAAENNKYLVGNAIVQGG
ncbi:DUF6519 domain-containing protein [Limobrevibacterium gyesilva]|uniref:DUF6519 domain-containing protein n=1 Tax=Limobrevibacterium gyesilva TaxID=2991712 RepID=A0AA41YK98_9PROT|nr:DUF6519 domain-containing protein [Limobrevibacterium gyesilva]MCW3475296.1 DUF6519 domain-containing protein [Limobrevibacterium gyesilva]